MNSLVRVSAVLTNGPFLLNLDCDHYINNSKALREAMIGKEYNKGWLCIKESVLFTCNSLRILNRHSQKPCCRRMGWLKKEKK
ncbi:unnamed protein product [Lathyrus sativus]|nr:unnamed protein product [Lathyrus sativus]